MAYVLPGPFVDHIATLTDPDTADLAAAAQDATLAHLSGTDRRVTLTVHQAARLHAIAAARSASAARTLAPAARYAQTHPEERPTATEPTTLEALAANGHRMVYKIVGTDPETGEPITSQWDAGHSDSCPCRTAKDAEPLPDW